MQLATDEKKSVDNGAEFNQAQEHDHRPGHECWCGFGVGSTGPLGIASPRSVKTLYDAYERPEMNGKRVSPAIAEQRIIMLERENADLKKRIAGFEKMAPRSVRLHRQQRDRIQKTDRQNAAGNDRKNVRTG